MRITDAERDDAADRVHRALHDGRITLVELDERLAQLYGSETTGDLERAVHGLPMSAERRLVAGEVLDLDAGISSGLVRSGYWTVPRRIRVHQPLSGRSRVDLDFSTADIGYRRVDLELRLGAYGSARLTVPQGATADLGLLRGGGRPRRQDVPVEGGTGVLHLVVSGRVARLREVRVRYPQPARWWQF